MGNSDDESDIVERDLSTLGLQYSQYKSESEASDGSKDGGDASDMKVIWNAQELAIGWAMRKMLYTLDNEHVAPHRTMKKFESLFSAASALWDTFQLEEPAEEELLWEEFDVEHFKPLADVDQEA